MYAKIPNNIYMVFLLLICLCQFNSYAPDGELKRIEGSSDSSLTSGT
jgi:hypothetical protein